MPNKKGDLTINTIIIAAIGLLVLIVMIAIFTGRLGVFSTTVGATQEGELACQNICSAIGMEGSFAQKEGGLMQPGTFKSGGEDARCYCNPK